MKKNCCLSEEQANALLSDLPEYDCVFPESDIGETLHVCSCGGLKEKIIALEKEMETIKATTRVVVDAIIELSELNKDNVCH